LQGSNEGLPAVPGSVWSLFAKLAWSDPDLVRAHTIVVEANLQGGTDGAGGPADGAPVQPDADVVARNYFIVSEIHGFVEVDPTNALEANSSEFVSLQIEDTSRNYSLFRAAMRMAPLAGTLTREGAPLRYHEYPLALLPNSRNVVTFVPLSGFPFAASGVTTLTTRRVGIHMHGVLVAERIVDRLIDENRVILSKNRLLPRL